MPNRYYIYLMKKAFTAFFICMAALLNAQAPEWRTFDSSNVALPTNIIISLAVDQNNMKWVGTYNGLVKTDGNNWTTYNTANSGLPDDIVRGVAIDGFNNVWAATNNGIAKFDGTYWTTYYEDTTNANPIYFLCIKADAVGNVLAGSEADGLFWYDAANSNWIVFNTQTSNIPQNRIESIDNVNSTIWLGTNSAGLVKFDPVAEVFIPYTPGNSAIPFDFVKKVTIAPDGKIWVGSGSDLPDSGLVVFDPVSEAVTLLDFATTGIKFDKVWAITFDDNDDVYIGTNDNDFAFARSDSAMWGEYQFGSSGIASNYVYDIVVDDSSYKWFATFKGISVYKEGGVFVSTHNQLADAFSIKAYPQPASDRLLFELTAQQPQKTNMELYNLQGTLIDKQQFYINGNTIVEYPVNQLSQGIYLARFVTGSTTKTLKLIIAGR
jgi:ligand-binding sensor domain-containing protein